MINILKKGVMEVLLARICKLCWRIDSITFFEGKGFFGI